MKTSPLHAGAYQLRRKENYFTKLMSIEKVTIF